MNGDAKQTYAESLQELTPMISLGAFTISLLISAEVFGRWDRFLLSVAGQAGIVAFNFLAADWLIAHHLGPRGEIARAAVNSVAGSVLYGAIGWPLAAWFWLPFIAMTMDTSEVDDRAAAVVLVQCGVQDAFALADGLAWIYPAAFTALAVVCRIITQRQKAMLRAMHESREAQHRALARAHEELKAEVVARERAELELRQAQKLEAVGRLAAGIAHEINTPMQVIGDSLQFVRDGVAELLGPAACEIDRAYLGENLPVALDLSDDAIKRVATIVRSMSQFARPHLDETAPIDLDHAVQDTVAICRHEYKRVADVELRLGAVPLVYGNGGELNQVLLAVVINAAHAIADVVGESGRRGRIAVTTACEGGEVVVTITDTGGGIPDEIRPHIFDPFFTTKPVGRGIGQSLAVSRAVIERHGGRLAFETEVGRGTTFTIRLPVYDGEGGRDAQLAERSRGAA